MLMITGQLLQQLRSLKGLPQKDVANKLNISQSYYSRIEKRRAIDGVLLPQVLKALDYTIEEVEGIKKNLPKSR